jgi:hypothetical protein
MAQVDLIISHLHLHDHMLDVTITAPDGRQVSMMVDPDDHPHLRNTFKEFKKALVAASRTVMLDMVAGGIIPDELPPTIVRPCRVCDRMDETNVQRGPNVYCVNHDPEKSRG